MKKTKVKKPKREVTGIDISKIKNGFMITVNVKTYTKTGDYNWDDEKYFCGEAYELLDKVSDLVTENYLD